MKEYNIETIKKLEDIAKEQVNYDSTQQYYFELQVKVFDVVKDYPIKSEDRDVVTKHDYIKRYHSMVDDYRRLKSYMNSRKYIPNKFFDGC